MNVYFMRHGETDWNAEQRLQGRSDIPLNEKGVSLAEYTAEQMKKEGLCFDQCFVSPLGRARQTAEIITNGMGLTPEVDERIAEICFGDYEGKRIQDLREGIYADKMAPFFLDTANYHPDHNAETLDELFGRLMDFWKDKVLPLEGKKEDVLVCCHGAVCRAFMVLLKPLEVKDYWSEHQFNCSLNMVKVTSGKTEVIYENKIYYDPAILIKNPLLK